MHILSNYLHFHWQFKSVILGCSQHLKNSGSLKMIFYFLDVDFSSDKYGKSCFLNFIGHLYPFCVCV